MFERMMDAAKQARLDRRVRGLLAEAGVDAGAQLSLRATDAGWRATIVLAEHPNFDSAAARALEARLAAVDGIAAATLVTTLHRERTTVGPSAPPAPARIERGHANPLALPGARKPANTEAPLEPGAAGGARARLAKQRPGNATRVLAVASGKGGVGKSTVAAQLALALSRRGDTVGLLDLDIHGPSLPVMFDLEGLRPEVVDGQIMPLSAAGLQLMSIGFLVSEEQALAWRGPMVMGAARQLLDEVRWPALDWLVIDTPPGTGDTHLTLLQRTRIDGAIIVTTPSVLALADVRRGAALFRRMEVPILGLVENMALLPDGGPLFGPPLDDAQLQQLDLQSLARLALDPLLGQPIGREAPDVGHPAFDALADTLWREFSAQSASAPLDHHADGP